MPTLMSQETFSKIAAVHSDLCAMDWNTTGHPSNIFVPWVGARLKAERRGIYYVGIALAPEKRRDQEQNFDNCLKWTKDICARRYNWSHTPFWRFLDSLTNELLGYRFFECSDRWGWSNLVKIAWSKRTPSRWPSDLINEQRDACIAALTEELGKLAGSIIFIASNEERGLLPTALIGNWNKQLEDAGIWWQLEPHTRNLYIHGYHPYAALRFREEMLGDTVKLAHQHLPSFQ